MAHCSLKNLVRQKLYAGEASLGTFVTIGSPDIVDILKHLGLDWFIFDTEHSYMSTDTVKTMMQALGDGKASPMVRIGQIDQYLVKRALDIGGEGLLVPLVNSPEEAEKLIKFAMYPPKGVRGAGPGRASRYGMNFAEYLRTANEELLIAVQIETKEALANSREILGTNRVDVGFVGPTDLTLALGLWDDRSNPKVIEAMEQVVKVCNDLGKIPGTMATSVEEARKFLKLGFKFLSLASDARFLLSGARSFISIKEERH